MTSGPRTKSLASLSLGIVTALAFAACTGTASTPPSTQPSASTGNSVSPSASVATGALPTPELTQVRLGVVDDITDHCGEIAIEDGLFAKNGLKVTTQVFTSDGSMNTALLAGQVDFIFPSGVSQVIGSLRTNSPLLVEFMSQDNITDNLYTTKNVKVPQDLKGKSIAISNFGSDTYGEALIMLRTMGLSVSDVTITPIGDDAARRAALAAGSVAGSLNDRAEHAAMTAAGFNTLLLSTAITDRLPVSAALTTRAFAQQNPNTVLALVASMVEGQHRFLTNPTDAIQAAMKFEKIDLPTATLDVQADLPGWTPTNGRPTLTEFKDAQTLFAKTDAALASVDVTQAFTTQYLDQLVSLGWFQANGITP
jgi:NitT/TauT family transport system substrate-binding protein